MMEMVSRREKKKNPPQRLGCPRTVRDEKEQNLLYSLGCWTHTPHTPQTPTLTHSPSWSPSLTFPFHSGTADPPPAPRASPPGGLSTPPGHSWQMLQHRGALAWPCRGKEEMRVGHGGTGSRDTRDIPGSAVPAVLPATGVCLHLAPAFPVSTEGRNDGNSLDAVSQQDTEPRSEGVTPGRSPSCSLGRGPSHPTHRVHPRGSAQHSFILF